MSPEPEPAPTRIPVSTVEDILFSETFLTEPNNDIQLQYFIDSISVSPEQISEVSTATTGQINNPTWHLIRKGRLTASNFGCVLNAKRATPSLIKRLLGEYDISRVKSVILGVHNDDEGVKAFVNCTGLQVIETGLWLHPTGVLGLHLVD
jgi:hypothetical protein